MRYKTFYSYIILSITVFPFSLWGEGLNHDFLPYKKKLQEKIFAGEIFSESNVSSTTMLGKKTQQLSFSIAGLHPKSCAYALKKLSLYENYSQFLDFVKISQYDEKHNAINFLLSHPLLPYDMQLTFKLPRIVKEGVYPFKFEMGILKDLNGEIYAINHDGRCLFFTKANWKGPHTGFPDLVFEFFSQALAKLSMERLFRHSSTLQR